MTGAPQHLVEHLQDLQKAFAIDPQLASAGALDIVLRHFHDIGIPDALLIPYLELRGALVDAASGIHNKITAVKPRERGAKGPNTPIEDAHTWATAAAALSFLILAGRPKKEAAKEIQSRTKDRFNARELSHYRTRLTRVNGRARQEAKAHFDWIVRSWRSEQQLSAEERAEEVMKVLVEITAKP